MALILKGTPDTNAESEDIVAQSGLTAAVVHSLGDGKFIVDTDDGTGTQALVNADAATAYAVRIQKRTGTLGFATMSGLAGGVTTYQLALTGGALPANARVAGFSIAAMTGFDDATHANFDAELGIAGANDVMASTSVKAGAAAAPKAGTAASLGYFGAPAVGTPTIKLTGAVDLNTLTAGSITVELFFFVLA